MRRISGVSNGSAMVNQKGANGTSAFQGVGAPSLIRNKPNLIVRNYYAIRRIFAKS
jgi:hypothetical protein